MATYRLIEDGGRPQDTWIMVKSLKVLRGLHGWILNEFVIMIKTKIPNIRDKAFIFVRSCR